MRRTSVLGRTGEAACAVKKLGFSSLGRSVVFVGKSAQAISAHDCASRQRRHRGWPLDLALEDVRLVPDDQELHPAAGVRPVANDGCIEEQTEDGNQESEKYCRPSWVVGPSPLRGIPAGTAFGVS